VIDVLADDGRSAFGLAAALDGERVPWRRIRRAEEFDARALIVATRALDASAAALLRRVPSLVLGVPQGLPPDLFGHTACSVVDEPIRLAIDGSILAADVRARAMQFRVRHLRLPRAPRGVLAGRPHGTVLGVGGVADGAMLPVVVQVAGAPCTWSLVDLGAALADLMDEGYRPIESVAARPIPRLVLATYYRMPESIRRVVQRRAYRGLTAALAALGDRASDYPVDASGWLLGEMLLALVRRTAGTLVRLARWPAPFDAAAALTHDIEPCRYAYRRGLPRLLEQLTARPHPATFGIVARPAVRHLGRRGVASLAAHEIVCHGLEHRGETLVGTRDEIGRGLDDARQSVETTLGRRVDGFRSPRLDRSRELLWALDRSGFEFDSSWPDVDRENLHGYGTGVRLNVPFRPPIADDDGVPRPSRCLELPVSAPDCIQPLFEGASPWALRRAVRQKLAFLRQTGGLYVGIVHAGVFGARDADRREAHLRFVAHEVQRGNVWLTSLRGIADWWRARERVEIESHDERLVVSNHGERTVTGLRLVLESGTATRTISVPALAPGGAVTLDTGSYPRAATR
jgi:peptidoglycan/xylan/chitin deacetylase (PgdA/CDA1 family)